VGWAAVRKAEANARRATPVERALIAAVAKRYRSTGEVDPSNSAPLLNAYVDAMRAVAAKYPKDLDVQTMYAEALMNTNPWKLWKPDGTPNPGTEQILSALRHVIDQDPKHPGANHYYIHAVEASQHPEQGVASAEALEGMMPAAGHLEHMPAHIMQRVGRYEDASEANRKGANADSQYLSKTQPIDYYAMYVAHNFQFLAYSAAMEGRKAETLSAMKQMRAAFPEEALLAMPGIDWYGAEPYMALMRFGLWDEILAEPRPNARLKAMTGGYLSAKATALAAKGRAAAARQSLDELDKLRATIPADAGAGNNTVHDVLNVAFLLARSQIELAEHNRDAALATLVAAVAQEDKLAYDEPADWFLPVRHLLGAELLKAGQNAQAEAVYREDLRRNPDNGWSLFGLSQALRAQHKSAEAAATETKFREAWKHADVTLTSSTL